MLSQIHKIIFKNLDIEDTVSEGSKGSKERVTENWRKGDPGYEVTQGLESVPSAILWKGRMFPMKWVI